MADMIRFDSPRHQSNIIKVLGIGGGGSNAVNHMYKQGIQGVDFIICNTDNQALELSPVPVKIQLGSSLTEGRGAGSIPEVGKNAAMENVQDLQSLLEKDTKMLFITAGMGGGTGTGGAPIIAATAKEMGILTVAIVTMPFSFEGNKRRKQAELGIEELRKNVDTILIISNDKLRELHGNLKLSEAFSKADDILTTAAKGIAELITVTGYINVDFEDVKTVMKDSGVAIMGTGIAEGESRANTAVQTALSSPLLNDNQIRGAKNILLYISSGNDEIQMDEVTEITEYIQNEAGSTADIIWGNGFDESLGAKISVTIVATGFETAVGRSPQLPGLNSKPEIVVHDLEEAVKTVATTPLAEMQEPEKTADELLDFTVKFVDSPENTTSSPQAEIAESETSSAVSEPFSSNAARIDTQAPAPGFEQTEQYRKSMDRMSRLKEMSQIRSEDGLRMIESVPAYQRMGVKLSDTIPSSESQISRYTLGDNPDAPGEIRSNNSYLHDNVD